MRVRVLELKGFQSATLDGAINGFYEWRGGLQDETFVDILMDIGSLQMAPEDGEGEGAATEDTNPAATLLVAYTR